MNPENRGRMIAGAVLILLGIAFFAMQFLGELGASSILFFVGLVLIGGYFYTRSYGLLIPGCLLAGLALGQLAERSGLTSFMGLSGVGLGLGFVAIYLIDLVYRGSASWWPLIPGGALVLTGLATANQTFQDLLARGWPLILVAIGLVLLAGAFGLTARRNT